MLDKRALLVVQVKFRLVTRSANFKCNRAPRAHDILVFECLKRLPKYTLDPNISRVWLA